MKVSLFPILLPTFATSCFTSFKKFFHFFEINIITSFLSFSFLSLAPLVYPLALIQIHGLFSFVLCLKSMMSSAIGTSLTSGEGNEGQYQQPAVFWESHEQPWTTTQDRDSHAWCWDFGWRVLGGAWSAQIGIFIWTIYAYLYAYLHMLYF